MQELIVNDLSFDHPPALRLLQVGRYARTVGQHWKASSERQNLQDRLPLGTVVALPLFAGDLHRSIFAVMIAVAFRKTVVYSNCG